MNIQNLATSEEIKETNVAMQHVVTYKPSFIQFGIQFYRITGPQGHPHLNSDMSEEGMREWQVVSE